MKSLLTLKEIKMLQKLKIKGINWFDAVNIKESELMKVIEKYNFHELDIEACLEENQRPRVDKYKDYIFMVLHFPKYNTEKKIYEINEFNIFLGKNFLISLRTKGGTSTSGIFEKYKNIQIGKNNDFKISTGFILYEVIQKMLENIFTIQDRLRISLKNIEKKVFENTNSSLVKEVMIKKRSLMILKHMLFPQITVMKSLESYMNNMFNDKIEVYFEDLEDKIGRITNDIKILEEHIISIEDAFKLIIDIKTNNIIRMLTIFSAFLLPLTLITSFYGMNVSDLPLLNNVTYIYYLFIVAALVMISIYYHLRKKGTI